jgi:predicted DNA-binding transcriptional regulator AlpA
LTLRELLTEICQLSADDLPAIAMALAGRMAETRTSAPAESSPAADDLLDAETAAALLGVSPSWLYHRNKLPFRVKVGGKLKFRRSGIDRWLKQRQSV